MAASGKIKKKKPEVFKELCAQLRLECQPDWLSTMGTITKVGLNAVLEKLAWKTGIPPEGLPGYKDLSWRFQQKSVDAFLLAIEIINKTAITHRLESFLLLICNAWELLLKAKILEDEENEDAIRDNSDPDKTLGLLKCARKCAGDTSDIYDNLTYVNDLRNKATHFFIPDIPKDILMLFQSCLINYQALAAQWFGIDLAEQTSTSMMIILDLDLRTWDDQSAILKGSMRKPDFDYLSSFCAKLHADRTERTHPDQFALSIEHSVRITKSKDEADISLAAGPSDRQIGIIEKTVDIEKTYPYAFQKVLDEINSTCKPRPEINKHDMTCIRNVFHLVDNRKRFYPLPGGYPGRYSQEFIDWVVGEYKKDNEFFQKTRKKYQEMQKQGRIQD